jgi:hypothetical protein
MDEMELIARWLNHHGGRTLNDVKSDELGPYVIMGGLNGVPEKVYIPSIEMVCKYLNLSYPQFSAKKS